MTVASISIPSLTLVTGPARSGKSEWAEALAQRSAKSVVYVATARLDEQDSDWQCRIARHQQRRPADWQTIAVPLELAAAIQMATADQCLLIDSLGTWLANLLEQEAAIWEGMAQSLLESLEATPAPVIVVAEEVGWGVVPAYPLGRQFRDRLGNLTRQIGAIAGAVYLVTGGYALNLTQLGVPLDRQPSPES